MLVCSLLISARKIGIQGQFFEYLDCLHGFSSSWNCFMNWFTVQIYDGSRILHNFYLLLFPSNREEGTFLVLSSLLEIVGLNTGFPDCLNKPNIREKCLLVRLETVSNGLDLRVLTLVVAGKTRRLFTSIMGHFLVWANGGTLFFSLLFRNPLFVKKSFWYISSMN